MHVILTEKAETMLRSYGTPAVITIRILPSCSCSATAYLELIQDEIHTNDIIFEKEGLFLQCNSYAKECIGPELHIEYKTGFRLYTKNETLAYGLSVQGGH
ncbi:hypothetical protein [Ectobacillus polymachus]|uniref:hypothetical protein n=1 Tax=Ectobacillus polymachus TaxID=1508806 RepID=UPI003A858402